MKIQDLLESDKSFDDIIDAIEGCIDATLSHDSGEGDGDDAYDRMHDANEDLRNALLAAVKKGLTKQDVMRIILQTIKDIIETPEQKSTFSEILDSVIIDTLPAKLAPTKAELKTIQKSIYTPLDHKQHLQNEVDGAHLDLQHAKNRHAKAVADLKKHLDKHPHLKD